MCPVSLCVPKKKLPKLKSRPMNGSSKRLQPSKHFIFNYVKTTNSNGIDLQETVTGFLVKL
jgi:hypothetical protein